PRAEPTALEAGPRCDAVGLEPSAVLGLDRRCPPVVAGDRSPGCTMADVAALVGGVDTPCGPPAGAGFDEGAACEQRWALRAARDDCLQLFRSHDGAGAMGGVVVVVVHQHGGVNQVLPRRSDAGYAGILVADRLAKPILGLAGAQAPDGARIPEICATVVQ